jgi:basic amino acid/polyamine antiporter, APA family
MMASSSPERSSSRHSPLAREIGTPLLTIYGLGTILGAGIYVIIGEVAGAAGFLAPLAFLLAAAVAGLTALSFSELVARIPESGGPVDFTHRAFGRRWVAAATGWALAATGVVSAATILTGFQQYLSIFVSWPGWVVVAGTGILLGVVAAVGLKESAWVMGTTTALGVGGLIYVIWMAAPTMGEGMGEVTGAVTSLDGGLASGLFLGAFLAFYSFIGFEDMVNLAEEVEDARTSVPRAIVVALVVSLVLYVVVSWAAVSVVPPQELAGSEAPLVAVVEARGQPGWILGLVSLFIIVNGALAQIIMASRLLMDMGRDDLGAPAFLRRVHPRTNTPLLTTALATAAVLLLALFLPLRSLANLTSAIVLGVFATVNASLIVLKGRGQPEAVPDVPRWIPWTGAIVSAGAVVAQLLVDGVGG